MPTYVCTVREGQLSPDQKSKIAAEVTRIHSEVTGAPAFFAQVIFEEVKPGNHFMGGVPLVHDQLYDKIFVYGRVRAGRSIQEKLKMIKLMAEAVGEAAGVRRTGVWVYIAGLPSPTRVGLFQDQKRGARAGRPLAPVRATTRGFIGSRPSRCNSSRASLRPDG